MQAMWSKLEMKSAAKAKEEEEKKGNLAGEAPALNERLAQETLEMVPSGGTPMSKGKCARTQVVQFTDADGDPGSFRLQSKGKQEKTLELWYGSRGTMEQRVQNDISIVVYDQQSGDVSVGSVGNLVGGEFVIEDHALVMGKVETMCAKVRAQFKTKHKKLIVASAAEEVAVAHVHDEGDESGIDDGRWWNTNGHHLIGCATLVKYSSGRKHRLAHGRLKQWAPEGERADEPALWQNVHEDGYTEEMQLHEAEEAVRAAEAEAAS
jgi:hypothetical protein